MSGDALELKMYDCAINESHEDALFRGYCAGKKVMKNWALNCAKSQRLNPED